MSGKGERVWMPWTAAEIQTLQRMYPDQGLAACASALPRHTLNSIQARVSKLGLKVTSQRRSEIMRTALLGRPRDTGRISHTEAWPGPQPVDGVLVAWTQRRERRAA